MIARDIDIKGLCVSIYTTTRDGKRGIMVRRRLVSPEFIELFFSIKSGNIEPSQSSLFYNLPESERDFLALCVHQAKIHNEIFEKMLAKSSSSLYERMKLLEGGIGSGVISQQLVDEFDSIVDRLINSGQFTISYGSKLKKKIKRLKEHNTPI